MTYGDTNAASNLIKVQRTTNNILSNQSKQSGPRFSKDFLD